MCYGPNTPQNQTYIVFPLVSRYPWSTNSAHISKLIATVYDPDTSFSQNCPDALISISSLWSHIQFYD